MIRILYGLFVGKGWVSRAEFWALPPGEVWWILDAHLPPERDAPQDQNERLYQSLMAATKEKEEAG